MVFSSYFEFINNYFFVIDARISIIRIKIVTSLKFDLSKECKMDRDQMNSVEVYDPVKKCHYRILVPQDSERIGK